MGNIAVRVITKLALIGLFLGATAQAQIGNVDAPEFEDVVAGPTTIRGWAMDSQAVLTKVEMFIDGADFGPVTYGGNRASACEAVGHYPGCPNVGWTIQCNMGSLPDGPHMLKIVSTTSDGRQSWMIRAFIVDNARRGLTATTAYKIETAATGSVLEASAAGPTQGAAIQQHPYLRRPNQLWTINATDSGNFTFESLSSSEVLTPVDYPGSKGTRLTQQWDFGELPQEWTMVSAGNSSFALLNGGNGLALDLPSGSAENGAPLELRTYSGERNQQWRFVPVLDVPSSTPVLATHKVVSANDLKYKNLLSQPGGLACAARQAGHLIVEQYSAVPTPRNLSSLAHSSDLIVMGKVVAQTSSVNNTTNVVTTRVHLHADEQFKGTLIRDVYLAIPGGHVVFGANARADVRTFESSSIGTGLEILVFLSRSNDSDDAYIPTNGMEGIFWVSLADGRVTSVTRYDRHPHLLKTTDVPLTAFRTQLSVAGAPIRP